MATTAKELIEIIQKYTKPDEIVIWQYYTREDFEYDENQIALTNDEFAEVADRIDKHLWEGLSDEIAEAIWELQKKKGQE